MCLAIPGRVVELVDEVNRIATVDVAGVRRNVSVGLLDAEGDGAEPGDWVLIHVGFAISKVDEREALATLRGLRQGLAARGTELSLPELRPTCFDPVRGRGGSPSSCRPGSPGRCRSTSSP